MKVEITDHAIIRLEERLYMRFLRTSKTSENKATWIRRLSLEALDRGKRLSNEQSGLKYRYSGITFIFNQLNVDHFVLITVYKNKR